MSTFTQIYYHIVFSTKDRRPTLDEPGRERLLRYMWGTIKNRNCHLYRINAVRDHVHIFSDLHPTVCLANYIKEIKTSATKWIKENRVFPAFSHWQDNYAAFTHSFPEKARLIEYVKSQEEHHKQVDFREELIRLLEEAGIEYDEKYLL